MSPFATKLHTLLPKPCFDRPFVCLGNPESCTAILIGENPATITSVDWWSYWSDSLGFDLERWQSMYSESRRERGKAAVSPTRGRISRLRSAGVNCLETNVFMNERLLSHGAGTANSNLLDLAIETLPELTSIIAHGKEAKAFVETRSIPDRFRVFKTKHFRLLSYATIDNLGASIRAA